MSDPETKIKQIKANREIHNRPEVKQKIKEYQNLPETKEMHRKVLNKTREREDVKNKIKEYKSLPWVKEKFKESIAHSLNKNKRTRIENKIFDVLFNLNIKNEQQKYIKGIGTVDFYLSDYNLIIECDGDYWHANPETYKEDRTGDHSRTNSSGFVYP
jgi:very-short-patch-repair endonuclease